MKNDGWGLTISPDGEWIGTDSTDTLYFMRPSTDGTMLEETRRVRRSPAPACRRLSSELSRSRFPRLRIV